MTPSSTSPAPAVVGRISQLYTEIYATLKQLATLLPLHCATSTASEQELLKIFAQPVHELLSTPGNPIYGAGFCASGDFCSTGNPLVWWQGPQVEKLSAATFGPGQTAVDLFRLEWFRVPAQSGEKHIAGPFVDYLCSNDITVTVSLPVTLRGKFVGVVCADILVSTIEQLFAADFLLFQQAVLVNHNDRIIFGSGDFYTTGELLPPANLPRFEIPGTNLALLLQSS